MSGTKDVEVIGRGRFLQLLSRDGWEYAQRIGSRGVVVMLAVTRDQELILVEQARPAVQARVIEPPAGLVGDEAGHEDEDLVAAARRELIEETGYDAERFEILAHAPSSPGSFDEILHFLRAHGVHRVGDGGGVGDEEIQVHTVPLAGIESWLQRRQAAGVLIDLKTYAGLHLLQPAPDRGGSRSGGPDPG